MVENLYIAYFGYGSLVNLDTLRTPYLEAVPARVSGWRRVWLARPAVVGSFAPKAGLAFLSVERDPDCVIDGMLILDHKSSLPAIDEREVLYERVALADQELEILKPFSQKAGSVEPYLYEATEFPQAEGVQILGSYLDVVMQGYFCHFGEEGVRRFIETTANFDCAVLDDRDAPLYPRPVTLTREERALFDDCLSQR